MPEGPRWRAVGFGLGGNLGDAAAAIERALALLRADPGIAVDAMSSFYRTKPWGPVAQPDFVNACALGRTRLAPRALLTTVKAVEAKVGRTDGERWGPRAIDVDILFYEGETLDTPDLVVPHQSLFERAFVLVPLAEIAPDLVVAGRRIGSAAAAIDAGGVIRVER